MNQAETIKLVIAIVLGYGLLIFTMWVFRDKGKQTEADKNDDKPKDLNTPEPIILIEQT